ncbi:RNA polymerase sigma factor [Pendulispora albinea]|uniref:Sigma-70 family RNA polymerase sigma factor n=1 Tax=Pendulispora albinea TaxID=2741071 RepID=A0ABZ2LZB2_9BACT
MPLTARSRFFNELLPFIRAGVRRARLQPCYADDAIQQTLGALAPHVEELMAMEESKRMGYVFLTAARKAMALRRRVGLEQARASDTEVEEWDCEVSFQGQTPERLLSAAQGAKRAERVLDTLGAHDRDLVLAVGDDGLSEREAARKLGMSRGSVAYRLRLARDALARAWLGTTSWRGRGPR